MSRVTRRECLGLGALLAAPSVSWAQPPPAGQTDDRAPDMIVVNARVLTMDPRLPGAEAFAVRDGRFLALGTTEVIRALAKSSTQVVDCQQMTVTPGFIDAHCHPGGIEELYDVNADLRSIAEIQQALRTRAAQTPPGYWVDAFKFDDTKLTDGRALSRKDLDAAAPEHPVRVAHRGGHTNWYNSKAFELAGVTRDTPDPHEAASCVTRTVTCKAGRREARHGSRTSASASSSRLNSSASARQGMEHISKLLAATGLTTVHDAGADADIAGVRGREKRHRTEAPSVHSC